MVDFVKLVLNNNQLVVTLLSIIVIFLSLLSFEKIRKALYGSLLTTLVSFLLAFISKVEMVNDAFTLLFRSLFILFGGKNEIPNLIGIEKNMLVSFATIENDCDLKLSNVYGYIQVFDIRIHFIDFIKNIRFNIESKIGFLKSMLINKSNLSKYRFTIRI